MTVAAVYCQPPRPAGRGQAVQRCPVHRAADALGLPVRTPARLRDDAAAQAAFAALGLDAAVVAAYGLILPQAMLDAPRRGCLNIHASLLPRWRGAAPIQAAILAGDAESGITIMQMDAGLDTGPMLLREAVPIGPQTTCGALHDAARAVRRSADPARRWRKTPPLVPQPAEGSDLRREADARGWADRLDPRRHRASSGGCAPSIRGPARSPRCRRTVLKVLAAELADGAGAPGTVLDDRLTVACGFGALRLTRVQLGGRAAMPADAFLRGHVVPAGTTLG